MRRLCKRGQSTGEYAILFAIVLGAVIAVQNYVRNRIAGGLKHYSDDYLNVVGNGTSINTANLNRSSSSTSSSRATMTSASSGNITSGSDSRQVQNAVQ